MTQHGDAQAVELQDVSRTFGGTKAVDGISLQVAAGEFLALLGPSGSGKTTLLMMVAGFEQPDRGRIRLGDRDVTEVPANRRGVGMVFQRYALFPHMTVAKNIAFPLRMRRMGRSDIRTRVARALELVQLGGLQDRMPAQLSGGQQQRVALARALVFEPPVLLLDEPLGALDRKLREELQTELRSLHRRVGCTVMLVTHDQEEAMAMAGRIALFARGRLEQLGTPEALYLRPGSAFVAGFIGRTNWLSTELVGPGTADAGLVAIRPEALRFATPGGGAMGQVSLPGRVEASLFLGAVRVWQVRLDAGPVVDVQAPAGGGGPEPGASVHVTWAAGDATRFPASAPA